MYMYMYNSHCAHVWVKAGEDDLPPVGAAVDCAENVVGHEVAIVVVNLRGGHVLPGTGVLDLNVESNVTWDFLEQLHVETHSSILIHVHFHVDDRFEGNFE